MSKASLKNDTWFTTIESAFVKNTDGVTRDFIDPAEARKAFDFTVEKHQSFTEDGRPIPKHYHLLRTDDNEIIPSRGLGDEYKPIQHVDVYDYLVNRVFPEIPDLKLESVGTMHGGGTGIICATMGDKFSITGDHSPHQHRLFFCNPNNGTGSAILGQTSVRLFCQNQVPAALRQASKKGNGFHIWHTTNSSVMIDNAIETIRAQALEFQNIREREERLAHIKVGDVELGHLLNKLFPLNRFEEGSRGWTRMDNQRQEVIYQFTEGDTAQSMFGDKTAWTLFNSITNMSYNPKRIGDGTDLAQIRYSGTVGSRADHVLKVMRAVEEEVGVAAA